MRKKILAITILLSLAPLGAVPVALGDVVTDMKIDLAGAHLGLNQCFKLIRPASTSIEWVKVKFDGPQSQGCDSEENAWRKRVYTLVPLSMPDFNSPLVPNFLAFVPEDENSKAEVAGESDYVLHDFVLFLRFDSEGPAEAWISMSLNEDHETLTESHDLDGQHGGSAHGVR